MKKTEQGKRIGPKRKLAWDDAEDIRMLARQGVPVKILAEDYGVWPNAIRQIIKKVTYRNPL